MIERLRQVDEHADELYPRLLQSLNVTFDRDTGEIVRDDVGARLLRFGLPDLIFRLECQCEREAKRGSGRDAIARAKIWRHVAEACKPGEQIPDISDNTQLNSWLPSSYPKFTKSLPARSCESCGLPWDVCRLHYDRSVCDQDDPTKAWFCYWCIRRNEVRERFHIEATKRGRCICCGTPWEAVAVGGHVPMNGSADEWRCADCVRAGRTESVTKKRRTFPCANPSCGRGPNLTRARVAVRGECCSDPCKNVVRALKARSSKPRKTDEKVSTVYQFRAGSAQVGTLPHF